MQRTSAIIVCVLLALGAAARAAEVSASLSSQAGYVGVPLVFRVTIANASSHATPTLPDIPGLKIQSLGPASRSLFTSSINGRTTRRETLSYHWAVIPQKPGKYVIPSLKIRVDGQLTQTASQTFTAIKSDVGDKLFVEVLGQKKTVYIGQALQLTLQIFIKPYHDQELGVRLQPRDMWQCVSLRGSQWGPFADALQERLDAGSWPHCQNVLRKDEKGREEIYYRYDLTAEINPQRTGPLRMDDVFVRVDWPTGLRVVRDFFGRASVRVAGVRPLVKGATVQEITVKPLPVANRPTFFAGAVGEGFKITAAAEPTNVRAGDPINLILQMSGPGRLDHLQAPPLDEMPEMTTRFKVPEEDLAGVVQDGRKYFQIQLRPRNEKVTEIPPIPLVSFNPKTEEYQTVYTKPIPLTVRPAEKLAGSAIISANGAPNSHDAPETPEVIRPAWYTDSPTLLAEPVQPGRGTWLALLLFGPAVVVVAMFGQVIQKRLGNPHARRRRLARRRAIKALSYAETPQAITATLRDFLADKFNAPPGLTAQEAASRLEQLGIEADMLDDARDLLHLAQHAPYAKPGQQQTAELRSRTRRLINQLDGLKVLKNGGSA